jgi:hypothetical protein
VLFGIHSSEGTQLIEYFPATSPLPWGFPQTTACQFVFPHAEKLTPIQEAKHGHI